MSTIGRRTEVLLALLSVYGPVRNFTGGALTHLIVFSPGLIPPLADWLAWATLPPLAVRLMRMIAGPASADQFAPWSVPRWKQMKKDGNPKMAALGHSDHRE